MVPHKFKIRNFHPWKESWIFIVIGCFFLAQVVELVDVRLSRSDRSHTPECEYSRSETRYERGTRQKQIDMNFLAQVVELVDTTVLEAVAVRCKSSSLFLGTTPRINHSKWLTIIVVRLEWCTLLVSSFASFYKKGEEAFVPCHFDSSDCNYS